MVPRRGAQPRLEPLALPLPAGRVPLRRADPDERGRAAGTTPSTSSSTPASSTTTGTGSPRSHYAKASPRRPADPDHGDQRRADAGRCTCCRPPGSATPGPGTRARPAPALAGGRRTGRCRSRIRSSARWSCSAGPAPGGTGPVPLFCENETNAARLFGAAPVTAVSRRTASTTTWSAARPRSTRRAPGPSARSGTSSRCRRASTAELRLRLRPAGAASAGGSAAGGADPLGADFDRGARASGEAEADEFYAELTPAGATADEAMVMRQAFAGLLWGKQFYYYDVAPLARRRPGPAAAAAGAAHQPQRRWRNFDAFDIMSMPDKWEYPWFAAWDLAFHCVALAHVDPAFAKYQLVLLCREWFQHPSGALPAYEWDFGDVNPPVQAWAALEVFALDGGTRPRLPDPDLRQAAGQLHLVGQPRGRRGQQPVRGRLPRPGQHRPDRPVAPAGGGTARAVRRDRLDGLLRAGDGARSPRSLQPVRASGRPAATWCSSSSSTSPRSRRPWTIRGCGTTTTASSTTS